MATIDPALTIDSVTLAVSDLHQSAAFYERVLGLPLLELDEQRSYFGWDAARPLLVLEQLERPLALPVHATGLFHVAWLHPSRGALADSVRRIAGLRWPLQGASDHGVSEALYLSDPDGLGIEIYRDRPREQWPRPEGGHSVSMVTLPLDLEGLLADSEGDPPPAQAAPDTRIGHVHLKVSDVGRASAFYRDRLGFEETAVLPSAAFLAAGGYHHHVGLNSWQSAGARPAPDGAPALTLLDFGLSSEQRLHELAGSPVSGGELTVVDPDGVALRFRSRALEGAQAPAAESRPSSSPES